MLFASRKWSGLGGDGGDGGGWNGSDGWKEEDEASRKMGDKARVIKGYQLQMADFLPRQKHGDKQRKGAENDKGGTDQSWR